MNFKDIRELDIAKDKFDYTRDLVDSVDYQEWVEYITKNNNHFTWYEDTLEGKNILNRINEIPADFKHSYLSILNNVRCFLHYNPQENSYSSSVGYSPESKKVSISFTINPSITDLNIYLTMANHLESYLLNKGKDIIDEEYLKALT